MTPTLAEIRDAKRRLHAARRIADALSEAVEISRLRGIERGAERRHRALSEARRRVAELERILERAGARFSRPGSP